MEVIWDVHIRRNPIDTRQDHMVLLWGSPMQFPYKSYGECMELYEIRSNPIEVDNRMSLEKKQ